MRVPRAARAVLREHLRQAIDVVGEMRQRHRAVLDEGHRLAVALHAHHDVEPGLAHVPQRFLRVRVGHRHDTARQAVVAHQLDELRELRHCLVARVADELDQQDRVGRADQRRVDRRAERGIGAREVDHRAIDQLDCRGRKRDDRLGALHRAIERGEIDDAERAMLRQRRKIQRQRTRPRERAFAADQQVREVDAPVVV